MDAPSSQLHLEVRDSVVRALATRRPILHHLNADTSWLLQIPRPANAVKHGSRIYYNVLIDPWFVGGQSDVAKWFSQQFHATESAVKSVAEVEELARQVEILAGGLRVGRKGRKRNIEEVEEETYVDCVAVSHEFTDHCHKETLLEVHRDVPVLATEQAANLISSWNHFRTVITTPTFTDNADWHDYSLSPLPSWLSISRLTASGDSLYYHSALLITFATHPFLSTATPKKRLSSLSINGDGAEDFSSNINGEEAECVIYTPHGIPHEALSPIAKADPPLHTLAFLHGLHDVSVSSAQQLNLGAKNGVLAQRILRAKYWIATHDEVKKGGGFISWFLRRKVWTVEDALKAARADDEGEFEDVRFQDMSNGESRILE
ncbi:major facilitator superfamily protein [Alternaria panax]|uniref:Major facilitator superfamily protein n=1 Tax=Alternaria panax TaxID=48097 RepID=A0AAD4FEQ2_9PLEO|nr:major facilitator superfamily protein [Alternaria panax]